MPLKLRIKPEGKCFFSGKGWFKNVGTRPIDVVFSEDIEIEREKRVKKVEAPVDNSVL